MSLKNKVEKMKMAGQSEGASEIEILRSALLEIADQHKSQQVHIIQRLESLEKAVAESNAQKTLDIETALQNSTDKLFVPMREKATDLVATIEQAGNRVEKIKSSVDWQKMLVYGFFTALFFLLGQGLIQYHFAPSVDFAKRIMWNIEYGTHNPNVEIKFYESEESAKAKYENQEKYELERDFAKRNK